MTSNFNVKMPLVERTVKFWKCNRCNYEWFPRGKEKPKTCPKCRSPYWDSERRNKIKGNRK
ncbi:MAG: hypothetical protein ABH821_05445 [archaeon]